MLLYTETVQNIKIILSQSNFYVKRIIQLNIRPAKLANPQNLIKTLSKRDQRIAKFINLQESEAELSTMRLGQEVATNWFPKAIFSRSLADFSEMSFLEFAENAVVYLGPKLLGEGVFRKLYTKKLDKGLKELVPTSASELMKEKKAHNKELMPVKAAIAVSALAIPLAEYSLSYIKNLLTVKLFKQADFNNIANLNKNKIEDPEKQRKVKESAKKHVKLAGGIYAGCLALSALLLTRGKNSKALNSLSEMILAPGSKLFKNNAKRAAGVNKYFGLDFGNKNGKLAMSNGQLTACVVVGGFGYFGAAKDRGKQNFKEVLYRFPLVGFYAITGSSLLEKGLKSALKKNDKYKNMISKDLQAPKLSELPDLAKKLAAQNKTTVEAEYKNLFKQKSTLIMTPFLFGIGFMGLFVAGVSRFFTQYRYNKEQAKTKEAQTNKIA